MATKHITLAYACVRAAREDVQSAPQVPESGLAL